MRVYYRHATAILPHAPVPADIESVQDALRMEQFARLNGFEPIGMIRTNPNRPQNHRSVEDAERAMIALASELTGV